MKVAIFGGTGFVGTYLIDALLGEGHEPLVMVRPGSEDKLEQPHRCTLTQGDIDDREAIAATVEGADAVIYNIGILREIPARGVTFRGLQLEGAKRAMDTAVAAGVRRFVLMSANGVRADGTGYQATKFLAEQYLATTALEWTIFRPSVLFGDPRGKLEFATQLYRDIIKSPLPAPLFYEGLWPTNPGNYAMSPVHVQDVAQAFVASLENPRAIGKIFPLGGPDVLTWKEILQIIATATGRKLFALPAPALGIGVLASLLDRFAFFPITRDQLAMLLEGNTCDGSEAFATFGITPKAFNLQNLSYLRANESSG
jgi:uncharacterized protein YbjT (DUF2867 family)